MSTEIQQKIAEHSKLAEQHYEILEKMKILEEQLVELNPLKVGQKVDVDGTVCFIKSVRYSKHWNEGYSFKYTFSKMKKDGKLGKGLTKRLWNLRTLKSPKE